MKQQLLNDDKKIICEIMPKIRMLYNRNNPGIVMFQSIDNFFDQSIDEVLYLEEASQLEKEFIRFKEKAGNVPQVVVIKDLGFFALGGNYKHAKSMKTAYLNAVESEETSFSIDGYEHIANKRMSGRITIVTGAAQGFGQGIAEMVAKEGGYVVIADLNLEGAEKIARQLNDSYGEGTSIAVQVDVSDEKSVEDMVNATVLVYGGLDIMIANAGIVIAGDLVEMTKERFELVSAVNYTGYFLCAKYASVPMKIQSKYNRNYWTDIIEINSKSGLMGSKNNFAYAGSKFGGVGLTQSFALELVEHSIKVNAICPGNLLDGPLWSDPDKGLFKQYFDSGKVPGAKSVADVRKHYESLVPMSRGCTVDDVSRAIYYIVEQKYETGQAIPVTGGQIMLK